MRRRPPISTRTDTLFPYTTLFRSTAGINQGREPRSAHPSLTPSQLYRTADGWIFIMCNKEKFWPVLASAVGHPEWRSEEHTSELQSLMRISYAVFCLKKKKQQCIRI